MKDNILPSAWTDIGQYDTPEHYTEHRKNGWKDVITIQMIKENPGKQRSMEKTKTVVQQPTKLKGITIVITNYSDEPGLIEIFTPAASPANK